MKYTAKLTHYAFDNTYTNARLFASKAERDAYFVNLVGYTQNTLVNFNARDILATDIIVKVEPNAPLFNLLNYNYCIIRGYTDNQIEKINGVERVKDGEQPTEVLYFYIKKSSQESGGQIRLYLANDILQNYWYDVTFSDCLIIKQHINRFEEDPNDNTKVIFRGTADSDLFEREEIKEAAKRLVSRQRLMLHTDTTPNSKLNQWLYDNVIAWCYYSVSQASYTHAGTTYLSPYVGVKKTTEGRAQMTYANSLFCVPIMKSGSISIISSDAIVLKPDANAMRDFLAQNNNYANVFSIKLSIKPPFDVKAYVEDTDYNIDEDLNVLTIESGTTSASGKFDLGINIKMLQVNTPNDQAGVISVLYDDPTPIKATMVDTSILPQISFNKSDFNANTNKNILYNPKINNADYKELRVCFAGASHIYDLQKLNNNNPEFEYYEMLTPDVTRGLLQYTPPNNNGIYSSAYGESYNGLTYSNDMSLPFAKGEDDTYFAENKNAYLSFQNQLLNNTYRRADNIAKQVGGFFSPTGLIGKAINTAVDIQAGFREMQFETTQFNLTIDNMRSAPEQLQNINGNAILTGAISQLGIYIELYEALINEQKIANDFAYDYGFVYNRYGNIKDYVNTRKYFNFIQANVENIIGNVSNEVKLLLRQILANGIKLWHTDNIQFEKENYEKWLEE